MYSFMGSRVTSGGVGREVEGITAEPAEDAPEVVAEEENMEEEELVVTSE
ncbi:hypothetical protein CDL15_Pgr005938 [Punica granatum]|uniref:Uncharacterized protein n=1 Tax=Punica granatum TaxID=22663 RepID=A0A218WHB3_PUNGR|nr:hypothetical protein CDL15_Pgr005938 [Punica granatum]